MSNITRWTYLRCIRMSRSLRVLLLYKIYRKQLIEIALGRLPNEERLKVQAAFTEALALEWFAGKHWGTLINEIYVKIYTKEPFPEDDMYAVIWNIARFMYDSAEYAGAYHAYSPEPTMRHCLSSTIYAQRQHYNGEVNMGLFFSAIPNPESEFDPWRECGL